MTSSTASPPKRQGDRDDDSYYTSFLCGRHRAHEATASFVTKGVTVIYHTEPEKALLGNTTFYFQVSKCRQEHDGFAYTTSEQGAPSFSSRNRGTPSRTLPCARTVVTAEFGARHCQKKKAPGLGQDRTEGDAPVPNLTLNGKPHLFLPTVNLSCAHTTRPPDNGSPRGRCRPNSPCETNGGT